MSFGTLFLWLFASVYLSPSRADTFYVGSIAEGCNAATLSAALLGALISGGDDEILLTTDLSGIQQELLNWDPSTIGGITIRGGYASCDAASSTGTSTVSGTSSGPIFDIQSTGGMDSVITLERLVVQGATDSRGVSVHGDGARLNLIDTDIRLNEGGLVATGGARVDLDRLTDIIDNDVGTGAGGGIWCVASTIHSAASISFNRASTGGGVWMQSGCEFNLLDGSFVSNNEADFGGGFAQSGSTSQLDRPISFTDDFGVQIVNNVARVYGGGLSVTNGATASLRETWVRGNSAAFRGGGIYADGPVEVLMDRRSTDCFVEPRCSWLEGNSITGVAGDREGSAVYAGDGASVSLFQTFVENHSAVDEQGFVLFATGTGTVLRMEGVQLAGNTTFSLFQAVDQAAIEAAFVSAAGNSWDPGSGSTDSLGGVAFGGASLNIYSSLLWDHGNFAPDAGSTIDLDCVLASTLNGASSATGDSAAGVDPLFLDIGALDLHVAANSPAVDFCDTSTYSPSHADLDRQLRGQDIPGVVDQLGPYDLGAYEFFGLIFSDGFEAGNTSAWSSSAP
ncbi:MAG: hypothetical protein MPN21_13320 [Thermoanaerobaculia bacterium]|nr:hypothetical protein [Thermoanaerobaculia bacterium]